MAFGDAVPILSGVDTAGDPEWDRTHKKKKIKSSGHCEGTMAGLAPAAHRCCRHVENAAQG